MARPIGARYVGRDGRGFRTYDVPSFPHAVTFAARARAQGFAVTLVSGFEHAHVRVWDAPRIFTSGTEAPAPG